MRHFKYTCFVRQAAGTAFVTNRANILSSESVTKIWQEAQLALANDKYRRQVALITCPRDKKLRLPPVLQEGKASLGFLFNQVSLQEHAGEGTAPTPPPPSLPSQRFPNTPHLMRDQKLQVIFRYAAMANIKPAEDGRCTNKSMKNTSTIKLPTLAFGPIGFVTSDIYGEKKKKNEKKINSRQQQNPSQSEMCLLSTHKIKCSVECLTYSDKAQRDEICCRMEHLSPATQKQTKQ